MISARLECEWSRKLWLMFVDEQIALGVDSPHIRKRVASAGEFFCTLESAFPDMESICSSTLATRIDSRVHRKYLLASRFVVSHLKLNDFNESREATTELRRVNDILARSEGRPFSGLLVEYANQLNREQTAPRTVRLYLRAAEAFCTNANVGMNGPWREQALVNHLKHFPGTANSLSRFVSHCKLRYGWDIQMPERFKWKDSTVSIKRTLAVVKSVLSVTSQGQISEMPLKDVSKLLAAALGVSAKQLMSATEPDGLTLVDGSISVVKDGVIEPGELLYPFARRWAELTTKRTSKAASKKATRRTVKTEEASSGNT